MKFGIVAITHDLLWVQYVTPVGWKQSKIPYHDFITFMWEKFPEIMKQSPIIYNEYDLANWLYEYGGYDNGVMYIFDDHNPNTYFNPLNFHTIHINPPKNISYNPYETTIVKERDPE